MWIYPAPSDIALRGEEALTGYEFGSKMAKHLFCGTCGISVVVVGEKIPFKPTNVRTMKGVNVEGLKLKKIDGWSSGPEYKV